MAPSAAVVFRPAGIDGAVLSSDDAQREGAAVAAIVKGASASTASPSTADANRFISSSWSIAPRALIVHAALDPSSALILDVVCRNFLALIGSADRQRERSTASWASV